jgi:hypothetical protein
VQTARGRFKPVQFHQKIHLDTGAAQTKSDLYESLVRRMFDDQLTWVEGRNPQRRIDAGNAVDSVAVAEQAENMALCIRCRDREQHE